MRVSVQLAMNRACRSGDARCALACQSRSARSTSGACGNLGAPPKPPHSGSKLRSSCCAAIAERRGIESLRARRGRRLQPGERLHHRRAGGAQLRLVVAVVIRHLLQQRAEGRQAVARRRREVGATEERPLVVMHQEHGQRPAAAAARQQLVRQLVEAIEVGALLAVHLDVHEALVHERRDGRVLEGLVRHDVAPVAGRVADGQQDRPALPAGARRAPPLPRDTSQPGCRRAGAGRGCLPAPGDCGGRCRALSWVGVAPLSRMRGTIPEGPKPMISDHSPGAAAAAQPAASPGSAVPMLRLRRGEDRRLRAGHQWVFANEVDVAATPLTAFKPGDHARIHDWREQFIGFAYVNPHALICARIMSRDPQQPIDHALLVQRLEGGAAAAYALFFRALLPAGVRRERRPARAGAGSLRRDARRPDRHRRHGGDAPGHRSGH